MRRITLVFLCGLCVLPAMAQDSRWITFKTIRDNWGKTEHQIDRTTIRQEGPYRIFWTRLWLPGSRQPLAISSHQQLYIVSQKFAVDCVRRRFATRYIDSTDPVQEKERRPADRRMDRTGQKSGHRPGCLQRPQMRVIAFLLALTVPAMAQPLQAPAAQTTAPGSNMPAGFYPHNPCIKPQKVMKDSTARTSSGSAQPWAPMVNKDVERFNQLALTFNACIKLYVDNARLDTQHILGVVNAAAAEVQGTNIPSMPAGGGNMPAGFYPRSPCIQPVPPENPAAAWDREAASRRGSVGSLPNDPRAEAYSLRVQMFNAQAAAFNVCIKTYMDKAQRDIQQIQDIVHAAVADANAPFADADPKGAFMTERRR